jgi:ribokinase
MHRQILVVGSLNADLVQRTARLPRPGETVAGSDLEVFCGGKGSNQACAAGRLGGSVSMAGAVGNDAFGARLRAELSAAGVGLSRVANSSRATGVASIFVLPSGENAIVLSPGANEDVSAEMALEAVESMGPGDLLLCQLEIPIGAVTAALAAARRRGVVTILDPAPARAIPAKALTDVDILTPNQTEAALLLGETADEVTSMAHARAAAARLLEKGPKAVIVKMGGAGCLVAAENAFTEIAGYSVEAIDTTAAGDAFNGALAVALSEGADLVEAARFANGAAALSVTRAGAMASLPNRQQVNEFLQSHASQENGGA